VVTPMNFQICGRRAALTLTQLTTKSGIYAIKSAVWCAFKGQYTKDNIGYTGAFIFIFFIIVCVLLYELYNK